MRITTWNVNGLRARSADVLAWIAREKPDLVCLQEIKCQGEQVPAELLALPGYRAYWHGMKGYSGVALLVAESLPVPRFHHPAFDLESRIVVAEVGELVVASIYVPNGGKDFPAKMRFLESLVAWAGELQASGKPLLLCGDLNVAREERDVHASLRKPGQIGTTADERALFARLLDTGLVDLGRQFAPDDAELFTWWAPWRNLRQKNVGWRIDYLLASPTLAKVATSCRAERLFGTSDHGPVTADLTLALAPGRDGLSTAPAPSSPRQLELL